MPKPFTIKIEGLKELEAAFKRSPNIVRSQIEKAIMLSVAIVNRNAKLEAPVGKTGMLKSGIHSIINPFRGRVESTVNYGIFVHEGTKAHIIRPINKKALYWKGAAHPVKVVHHPGTRANPFMKRGAKRSEIQVGVMFQRAINNVTKQLAK